MMKKYAKLPQIELNTNAICGMSPHLHQYFLFATRVVSGESMHFIFAKTKIV